MKRATDLILILLALPLWLPLALVTALLVLVFLGQPMLFRQRRAGINGKPFMIIKFRTMEERIDATGKLLPDGERLPRFGRILRCLSLDEVPEIWNVIRGEMSLVGPRPLPVEYTGRYNPRQRRRLECLPGITGWAQVNGRNALDWEERFEHDLWYVENRSLGLDFRILGRTFLAVLSRRGIAGEGSATMSEFTGSPGDPGAAPRPGEDPPGSPDPSHRNG